MSLEGTSIKDLSDGKGKGLLLLKGKEVAPPAH
jgi:hypothetical protein